MPPFINVEFRTNLSRILALVGPRSTLRGASAYGATAPGNSTALPEVLPVPTLAAKTSPSPSRANA